MDSILNHIKTAVYDKCSLQIAGFETEAESKEYKACRYQLSGRSILGRKAKRTPKKAGQFVTFWKRNEKGIIAPFEATDEVDFYVVNVQQDNKLGQFVFPKSVLIKKGIISTPSKEGKRAFRVYAKWDIVSNKQAERTQKWQLQYFYEVDTLTDLKKVSALYGF
ncbi:MAG: MepB family protein [Muricauda sp.]|nr:MULTISPECIES: MepB family protein [unclassified Allomuricauda]MAU16122.1 MepB family protein [Allomuricauda sp.]|tara:strand:- start:428 stop:919 length:492 start_codon:yes stop_codon:yes gene_type:complete